MSACARNAVAIGATALVAIALATPASATMVAAAQSDTDQAHAQAPQTIIWGPLDNKFYGGQDLHMTATTTAAQGAGGSTLSIDYTSLTPAVCTVSGSTVTIVSVGKCTIEATQPGNSAFDAAAPVDRSFTIGYRVTHLAPNSGTTFARGTTIPVSFRLADQASQAIPDALAASLGCTVTVTFAGTPPVCATYDAATRLFGADLKTAKNLAAGTSYQIAVRAVAGATTVASANIVVDSDVTALSTASNGYWMLGADGKVYPFGSARNLGNNAKPPVAFTARRDGRGYWIVDAEGGVSHFGAASGKGQHPKLEAGETVTTISATPSGNGYWLFTNRGRVFQYGDAKFYGDMTGVTLNGPIIASISTADGRGYYMVGSDGGVFSFGDAHFHGSTGNLRLNKPVVGISTTPASAGYWLVASDGGVFAFDAPFRGSMGATHLNKPVNGLVNYGNGYLMVASDGGIFDFSNKAFLGSLANHPPTAPIIAVAAFATN